MHRIASILILVLLSAWAYAQTGSLKGMVTDQRTGERLAGVNLIVRGTVRGAATNSAGEFRIGGLPQGKYSIYCSLVGYTSTTVEALDVMPETETMVNVSLVPAPIPMEQVVITAARRLQNVQDVPTSIAVVSAQELAQRAVVSVDDALRHVSGVNMMQDQVNIRGSTGYSRGVGSRVLLLIDGLPYLTGDTGEITWETLPLHEIDRIEVVKGAGSALYGSSALGGVINLVTKGIPDEPQTRFRLYTSIYDQPRHAQWRWSSKTRMHAGGNVGFSDRSGPFGYSISLGRSVDESFKENDLYQRWSIFTKLTYALSETQQAQVLVNFMRRSHGNFFWWRSLEEATRPAIDQLDGNVDWNRGNVSAAYSHALSKDLSYSIKTIYYGNFWRDDSAGRRNNVSASHLTQTEGQLTWIASPVHVLTAGLAANYDRVNSDIFGSHPGFGWAAYAQDEWSFTDDVRVTIGLRYDWQKVSVLAAAGQLNPKFGIVYRPDGETSFRASVGRGFRYPSISEIYTSVNTGVSQIRIVPNENLKAERSVSYEFGVSHSFGGNYWTDVALFQTDLDDLIEAGVDPERIVIRFENVTRARIRGLEVGARADWFDGLLGTNIGYTYVDPRDRSSNSVLRFRPRHLLYGSLTTSLEPIRLALEGRYISRVEAIDQRLVDLAPIVDGDARVDIKVVDVRSQVGLVNWGIPLVVDLAVTNVLNYHYVELIGNLAPVRTFHVGVRGAL